MRTRLPLLLVSLLTTLSAQELPPRSSEPLPARALESAAPVDDAVLRAAVEKAGAGTGPGRVLFDRPRADGPLWAAGRSWKASFDRDGFTFVPFFGAEAPRNFPVRLRLAGATVGGEPLSLADGEPVLDGGTVRTRRGALTEVVDTELEQVEQSFVFDALPHRGAIAVEVRIETELAPHPIAGGLRFANGHGHVDYTKAVAVDAAGRRLPLDIQWTGSSARMEIPATFVENAQLPLVLDPTLNGWILLASGQTQLQNDMDASTFQAIGGRTLVVYRRQWSITDQDCWAILFDGNLGLVAGDFVVDFSTEDWLNVAVAASNYAQNFLVVAEIRVGLLSYIGGRGVSGGAVVGSLFDIERDGVVGSGGNNFDPDVGGDPYYGSGKYCVVFQKRTAAGADIYMKLVTPAGALFTTDPVALGTAPSDESSPAISKSCGQSNGPPAQWLVTWQRTYGGAPFDQEIDGRFVGWNGALVGGVVMIATTVADETAPSPGSPIDVDGARYWPVCHEYAPVIGQPRDILCKCYRADGILQGSFTVSNGAANVDERDPEVDSDGARFVVCYTSQGPSSTSGVQAATVALLPLTNSFRVEERTNFNTSSFENFSQTNVCADYSGGSARTPRYVISFKHHETNSFTLWAFAGHTPGSFWSFRNSQCGNLTITPSGLPVIGQDMSFTVGGGGFSGTLLGFPGFAPLNGLGCSCWLGVVQGVSLGSPLVWRVPSNPVYVGATLSVQGWSFAGSQCLGLIDLSDTVDFTIR